MVPAYPHFLKDVKDRFWCFQVLYQEGAQCVRARPPELPARPAGHCRPWGYFFGVCVYCTLADLRTELPSANRSAPALAEPTTLGSSSMVAVQLILRACVCRGVLPKYISSKGCRR